MLGIKQNNLCRVPLDDHHTMYFRMYVDIREGAGAHPSRPQLLPNTPDCYGRFRSVQSRTNDYLIDRSV